MPAAKTRATMPANSIDFVDEDDAGGMLFGLIEHVSNARGTHTHEHLYKIRAGDGKERHFGLTRDRPRQQGLARAGRADHQHAARNVPAQLLKLTRVAQEFNQLFDFLLGFFDTRHVCKGHVDLVLALQLCPALAKRHGAASTRTALHLPHEIDPQTDEKQNRCDVEY